MKSPTDATKASCLNNFEVGTAAQAMLNKSHRRTCTRYHVAAGENHLLGGAVLYTLLVCIGTPSDQVIQQLCADLNSHSCVDEH